MPSFRRAVMLFLVFATALAQAQNRPESNEASIKLVAVVPESVRIAVPVEQARFEFQGTRGVAAIPIALSWNLRTNSRERLHVVAYFDDPGAALNDARGNRIPADRITATMDGGSAAGSKNKGALTLTSRRMAAGESSASETTTLRLVLDLEGLRLVPGTYAGVIHLQVRAY